uniref:Protein kinase domain-containing protein n=1 Tax=Stegastes partitus TaxID=144197 RepID=A0A3B5AXA0_9TELE
MNMANNLRIGKGSTLGSCHVVEDILGDGSFGVVAKCRNTKTNNIVAVKVIRGKECFVHSAIAEIAVLRRLQCLDSDTCSIVQWNGFFFDKENICIDFELLDQSLRDYLDGTKSRLSVGELRPVLHQVATALSHMHSIGIMHMDLKPDNIMVVDRHQHPLKVKLIDFGMAHPISVVKQGACMGTMYYCAPEMLLGAPFNECIDVWALGLIMAELATGCILYPGQAPYDVIRFVVECQGQPPDHVLDSGWEMNLNSLDEIHTLTLDVCNRIKAREVLEHQFFASSHTQEQRRDPDPHQAGSTVATVINTDSKKNQRIKEKNQRKDSKKRIKESKKRIKEKIQRKRKMNSNSSN